MATIVGFNIVPLVTADTHQVRPDGENGFCVARLVTTGNAATLKLYQGSVDAANLLTTLAVSDTSPSVDEQGFPIRYRDGLIAVLDAVAEAFVGWR